MDRNYWKSISENQRERKQPGFRETKAGTGEPSEATGPLWVSFWACIFTSLFTCSPFSK